MKRILAYLVGLAGMAGWHFGVHFHYFLFVAAWICISEYKEEQTEIKTKAYQGFAFAQSSVLLYLLMEQSGWKEIVAQLIVCIVFSLLVYGQSKGYQEKNENTDTQSKMIALFMPFMLPVSMFYLWMVFVPSDYNHYFIILYIISLVRFSNGIKTGIGQLYFYFSQVMVSLFIFQYVELKWFIFLSFLLFLGLFQFKKINQKTYV